jgi:hypothetical protein
MNDSLGYPFSYMGIPKQDEFVAPTNEGMAVHFLFLGESMVDSLNVFI